MIDLHCHILPGIDDGAPDLATSLEMARMAAADGIKLIACTPHMMPGVYDNTGPQVREAIVALQTQLDDAGIDLRLMTGADIHLQTGLARGLKDGRLLSLNDSRYFLFEPPHHVAPPRLEDAVFDVMAAGYQPLITHPERLSWIESHYEIMKKMVHGGAWMQITCGSITGRFGRRPQYWAERMLDEGLVHLIATDAHNLRNRKPNMSEARQAVADRLGEDEAHNMTVVRPRLVVENLPPTTAPVTVSARKAPANFSGMFRRLFAAAS